MSQRGVVEKLLLEADPRGGVHVVPDPGMDRLSDLGTSGAVRSGVESEVLPKSSEASSADQPTFLQKPKMRVLTREEREARMAAAQGWLGKKK